MLLNKDKNYLFFNNIKIKNNKKKKKMLLLKEEFKLSQSSNTFL